MPMGRFWYVFRMRDIVPHIYTERKFIFLTSGMFRQCKCNNTKVFERNLYVVKDYGLLTRSKNIFIGY